MSELKNVVKPLKSGRSNLAMTIFIPVNCRNNCPFCTSKQDYAEHKCAWRKVYDAINEVLVENPKTRDLPFTDVVITGGEPFMELNMLELMILRVHSLKPELRVYINSTMPAIHFEETLDFIRKYKRHISGINISRHMTNPFTETIATDEQIDQIAQIMDGNVRINSVLTKPVAECEEDILAFYNRFQKLNIECINFRADYRYITFENLHNPRTPDMIALDNLFGYRHNGGCNVCDSAVFETNKVVYHRGIERSSIEYNNHVEVNDIIIKQDGRILYDWE